MFWIRRTWKCIFLEDDSFTENHLNLYKWHHSILTILNSPENENLWISNNLPGHAFPFSNKDHCTKHITVSNIYLNPIVPKCSHKYANMRFYLDSKWSFFKTCENSAQKRRFIPKSITENGAAVHLCRSLLNYNISACREIP